MRLGRATIVREVCVQNGTEPNRGHDVSRTRREASNARVTIETEYVEVVGGDRSTTVANPT